MFNPTQNATSTPNPNKHKFFRIADATQLKLEEARQIAWEAKNKDVAMLLDLIINCRNYGAIPELKIEASRIGMLMSMLAMLDKDNEDKFGQQMDTSKE